MSTRRVAAQEDGTLREALQAIVDFPIDGDMSGSWHFAEVRLIARRALAAQPATPEGVTDR